MKLVKFMFGFRRALISGNKSNLCLGVGGHIIKQVKFVFGFKRALIS